MAFHKEEETKKGGRTPLRDNIVSYVARKERSMNRVTIFSHMLQNNELLWLSFRTILLYRKQNNDWQFFLEWSRNKLGFLKYCFICVHKNELYVFQQGRATLWMWLYSLIYGDEESLSKYTVYYESDYMSTDSYVIKFWSYLKKRLCKKCPVKFYYFDSNIRRVWRYQRGNQHLLIIETPGPSRKDRQHNDRQK